MDLNGTYRGFSPTRQSEAATGEIEITISDDAFTYRFATGTEVVSEHIARPTFLKLTADAVYIYAGSPERAAKTTGYELVEKGSVFLFVQEEPGYPDAVGVLLMDFSGHETFGITVLYTPEQVEAGLFEKGLQKLEADHGEVGVIPRLANNGLRC